MAEMTDIERRVRERLKAHTENYSVHGGCGGELTEWPDCHYVCERCEASGRGLDAVHPEDADYEHDVIALLSELGRVQATARALLRYDQGGGGDEVVP